MIQPANTGPDSLESAWNRTFDNPVQTSTDTGLFDAALTLPAVKGATADVGVELINAGAEAQWKQVQSWPVRFIMSITRRVRR